ncbi:FIST N domain protein [Rhodobacteraceae bacterium THAF1]|uniref:FIST N-terminal domain-containing protein n=1 Tax=Palleronia sp. THAF1 TaxID=2587842 RepID=UPI000F3CA9FB|nr:FIST N-terminal domain-containing protein [Palleronia sp. THAF1]QFU09122.1 FIST N domain protein [Palleronia sp. THAF1]VDC24070.1 FIST N domain protein [Rhodobacteraceae bacterium THAF1]
MTAQNSHIVAEQPGFAGLLSRACVPADAGIGALVEALGPKPLAHLFLFVSPEADFHALIAEARKAFPDTTLTACTTAGEIGPAGYTENTIVALGLPRAHFATRTILAEPLQALDIAAVADAVVRARMALVEDAPQFATTFAFVMIDGLSLREDSLLAALAPSLGAMPIFGGSAGDGRTFAQTLVAHDDAIHTDAGVLTLIATDARAHVFSLDHMTPTETRMVVTDADPEARIVRRINGAPAAAEYARIVNRDPGQLDSFTFAAHPVVVRMGERHHVRSIQRVTPDGALIFFSAIDEGMVLSVATSEPIAAHLDRELASLAMGDQMPDIIACDCILRRIEAEEHQQSRSVSDVLARYGATGFSTYGEQIGRMHINHTMTGVALYPPEPR